MSGYLLTVIGTVLCSAILTAILPSGKTSSLIKSTARLACLVAIFAPLLDFFKNGERIGENFIKTGIYTDKNFIEYCSKISVESAEKSLEEHLKEKYDVDFEVTLFFEKIQTEESGYKVERIKITKAVLLPMGEISEKEGEEIESYLLTNFNCPSEVLKNDGG